MLLKYRDDVVQFRILNKFVTKTEVTLLLNK